MRGIFRKQLNKAESPKNLKDLLKLITPPKGVKRKGEKDGSACRSRREVI